MDNEWVKTSLQLPWPAWESLYAAMFPSKRGNVAKPCRMVLGSLILQTRMSYTDRELVNQLCQNPYYQYFIGLEAFQHYPPFTPPLLVTWRKRIDLSFVVKANDILCDSMPRIYYSRSKGRKHGTLLATQICDAMLIIVSKMARRTLDYVLAEMRDAGYSQDAQDYVVANW